MWYPEHLVKVSGQVERIGKPTKEAFERYVASGTPVIVEGALGGGAVDARTGRSKWTCDYIKSRIGDNACELYVSRGGLYDQANHKVVKMNLSECIDRMSAPSQATPLFWPNEHYYLYHPPSRLFAPILADLAVPEFIPWDPAKDESALWISQPGNTTPPHSDFASSLLVQVLGEKRILLWDPSQWSKLYLSRLGEFPGRESPIDVTKPDVTKYPLFSEARALEGVLQPGDALCIPFGYIHCPRSETFSIAAEYWWGNRGFDRIRSTVTGPLLSYCADTPWVSFKLLVQGAIRRRLSKGENLASDPANVPSIIDTAVRMTIHA
jgi:hypothetical protein